METLIPWMKPSLCNKVISWYLNKIITIASFPAATIEDKPMQPFLYNFDNDT